MSTLTFRYLLVLTLFNQYTPERRDTSRAESDCLGTVAGKSEFSLSVDTLITHVPLQIISPQANKPVTGIVQDTLCGKLHRDAKPLLNWYSLGGEVVAA